MIATRQALATTCGRMSASSVVARSVSAFIARSASRVTCSMRTRALWKVKVSCGRSRSRSRRSEGTSVSMVVFELGTISPMRCIPFMVSSRVAVVGSGCGGRVAAGARASRPGHDGDPRRMRRGGVEPGRLLRCKGGRGRVRRFDRRGERRLRPRRTCMHAQPHRHGHKRRLRAERRPAREGPDVRGRWSRAVLRRVPRDARSRSRGHRIVMSRGPVVTLEQVRSFAIELPRTSEALVRGRVKFRVGRIVYLAFSRDESVMGFAFPKEWREALVGTEPEKFMPPKASDLRYNWALVRLAAIDTTDMRELVLDAWAMVVPKRLVAAY